MFNYHTNLKSSIDTFYIWTTFFCQIYGPLLSVLFKEKSVFYINPNNMKKIENSSRKRKDRKKEKEFTFVKLSTIFIESLYIYPTTKKL